MIDLEHSPWMRTIRPETLAANLAPLMIGAGIAYGDGVHHLASAFQAFLFVMALQIGVNALHAYRYRARTEGKNPGATSAVSLNTLALVGVAFLILAWLSAIGLIKKAGWPIAVICLSAILTGAIYSFGSRSLEKRGAGDILAFIFLGPLTVSATYYAQSLEMNPAVILCGVAPGLFAVAVMASNNARDMDKDRASGKMTWAVRRGKNFVLGEYLFTIIAASLMPVVIYLVTEDHLYSLSASIVSLLAVPLIIRAFLASEHSAWNNVIAGTIKLSLIYSVLFSIGWIL